MTSPTPDHLLAWLLDSDPALRWQVERDLAGAAPSVWQATRARVATEGIGARLLALQAPDGQWAGGAYFPAPPANGAEIEEAGQPWTATTWCLNSLREWGVGPKALEGTAERLATNSRREYGTWLQGERDRGRVWFEVDVPEGQPSKWLTFYGTRALGWWDSQAPAGAA